MKTKAAILVAQKKDLVIDELEIPSLDVGKVLVEIKATRICGSQLGEIDGVKGPDKYLPHLLGHEAGAIVREVGPMVSKVKAGDHVVCHWRPAPGISGACPQYDWNGKKVNAGHITTFSEYAILSESRVTPIPKDVDFELASLLADTITTGFGLITNDAKVKIGESLVVIGIGGIGMGVLAGAKLAGAYPIIGVDIYDHKLELAKKHGATHIINAKTSNMDGEILEIVGASGADVVIEGTGIPSVIESAYNLTTIVGRCILFGVIPFDKFVKLNTLSLHFGKKLIGTEGGQSQPHEDIPRYIAMLKAGLFSVDDYVSHRIKLDKINNGIELMRAGESIHTIVEF
jgi:S-(hydroxymethyl)glutathione dehydrogenase / alcohol dehydrogenase